MMLAPTKRLRSTGWQAISRGLKDGVFDLSHQYRSLGYYTKIFASRKTRAEVASEGRGPKIKFYELWVKPSPELLAARSKKNPQQVLPMSWKQAQVRRLPGGRVQVKISLPRRKRGRR